MSEHSELPLSLDAELVPDLLVGDENAWRLFHSRYAGRLQSVISQVTRRFPQLAAADHIDEIYGTLCLQLLSDDKRRLKSFDPERGTPLGSWLCTLARNSARDFLRSRRRQRCVSAFSGDVLDTELESDAPDAFAVCANHERTRQVTRLMDSLSQRDREFLQAYLAGLEPEQIAEQLGITVSTVYSKKHKILARLEKLLAN